MAAQGGEPQVTEITRHQQYHSAGLTEDDLEADPMIVFQRWFKAAQESGLVAEPEAMCLSTARRDTGEVSSRFVLLKRIDERGLVFFTNYESRKAVELDGNPRASLAFYWGPLHQQIRVCGRAERTSTQESLDYFQYRPVGSRVGAWASPQSQPLVSRAQLLDLVAQQENNFHLQPGSVDRETPTPADLLATIPLPPHWGGFRIVPDQVEFWVGRPNRLHDRFLYRRSLDHPHPVWSMQRLAP
ncbi:hypothetical protein PCANC_10066 [Puccinia coronata f. sp. avenae]|nr:hypothetical protein PCANC_26490 [Puccinia coronata f. sp. avenae]PLW40897.1 hypothetical protein PCASD_10765 [Puccinia coronata f. sp. avenae]PLW43473.1 hypothetical protein PCANC_10066 [Puccinia coronata f. sp. avenae]